MAKNNVDGVYSADPKTNKDAVKYETLSFMDMLNEDLEIMDSTASSLCMDNDIRLIVFSITEEGNIIKRISLSIHSDDAVESITSKPSFNISINDNVSYFTASLFVFGSAE